MICSMTAFARQAQQQDWGSLVWEIRSVNHRYLENHFKLPEALQSLEGPLRDMLRKRFNRGKLECSLKIQMQASSQSQFTVNQELLLQIIAAGETVQAKLQQPSALNPIELLRWPGVMTAPDTHSDDIGDKCLRAFEQALDQLLANRQREGSELKVFIEERLDTIVSITDAIRQQLPTILTAQREKLQSRLAELSAELDNERLEQEMVILAQKADVDEELDRLDTHIQEVRRVLNKGGACGRRLDFLMQELNREANTLSSKSIVSDTTQAAVELKVLIEQMREQIQNIE